MYLGEFERLLFFGGPYSNLDALLALQQQAVIHNISPENVVCTGDIVAYCGQPKETIEAIREWGIHVVMGNCEESLAYKALDCSCGFSEGSACDRLSIEWFEYANQQITDEQRQWFAQLPRRLRLNINQYSVLVIHGSVTSINQFLFASDDDQLFEEQFEACHDDIIIAGHAGIPFNKVIGDRLWHNAGTIGLPANDGCTNTWYSILEFQHHTSNLRVNFYELHYDYLQAYRAMKLVGLENDYSSALKTGLWPSMDVLPDKEICQQGYKIQPESLVI